MGEKKEAGYLLWVLIIKWCIAWCYTLQFIIKVNNNFSQRQAVLHEYPLTAGEKLKGLLLQPGISWWTDTKIYQNLCQFLWIIMHNIPINHFTSYIYTHTHIGGYSNQMETLKKLPVNEWVLQLLTPTLRDKGNNRSHISKN